MSTCMILNRGELTPGADPDEEPPTVRCEHEATHIMAVYVARGRSMEAHLCDEHYDALYPRPDTELQQMVESDPRLILPQ